MILSVIIPLYNCEKYIKDCLESLYRQDLEDSEFEIIVVNDGSTDNGRRVVEQMMQRRGNITLIDQTNRGLGLTRNRGIEAAKGEYIAFVDSDDEIHDGAFGYILTKVSQLPPADAPDLIIYKYQNVLLGDKPRHIELDKRAMLFTGSIQDFGNTYGLHPTSCNQMYRRDFLTRYKFNDSCYAEDLQFMVKIFENTATKVVYFDLPIYFYYMRENSMIHTYKKDYMQKVMDVYCAIMRMVSSSTLTDKYNKDKVDNFILTHIQSVAVVKLHSAYFSLGEIKKYLKKFREDGILPLRFIPNRVVQLLAFSCKHPYFMWSFGFFFRNIYLKHIKR